MANWLNAPIRDLLQPANEETVAKRNRQSNRLLADINNPTVPQVRANTALQNIQSPQSNSNFTGVKLAGADNISPAPINRSQKNNILLTNRMGNSAGEVIGDVEKFKRGLRDNYSKPRSNMDVTFDSSVDNASRERFLQNPVRPTAQINRGVRGSRLSGQVKNGIPIEFAKQEPELKLLTRENAPGMGWQARLRLNEQMLRNQQSNIESLRENNQKNQLNELEQYTLDTQKSLVNLQDRFAKATPEERQQLMPEMIARGIFKEPKTEKPDVRVIDKYNDLGQKIGQSIMQNDGTGYTDVTPKPQVSAMEQALSMSREDRVKLHSALKKMFPDKNPSEAEVQQIIQSGSWR